MPCLRFRQALAANAEREERLARPATAQDRNWLYESLATNLCTEFERLSEALFYQAISLDSSRLCATVGLRLAKRLPLSYVEALFTTQGYFNWRSTADLKGLARRYIVADLNPFDQLQKEEATAIDDLFCIRNHILHRSRPSLKSYRQITERYGYKQPPTPGLFLRRDGRLAHYRHQLTRAVAALERLGFADRPGPQRRPPSAPPQLAHPS